MNNTTAQTSYPAEVMVQRATALDTAEAAQRCQVSFRLVSQRVAQLSSCASQYTSSIPAADEELEVSLDVLVHDTPYTVLEVKKEQEASR